MMTCMTPNLHEGLNMTAILNKNVTTWTQSGDVETDPNLENSPPDGENNDGNGGGLIRTNCTRVNTTKITTLANETVRTETTSVKECQTLNTSSSNSGYTENRKKRATEITDLESEPLNNNELQFYIGFQFDGMKTYSNFTSLPVYEDPEYFKFEDEDHVRYFESKDDFMYIKVSKSINSQCNTFVKVGSNC